MLFQIHEKSVEDDEIGAIKLDNWVREILRRVCGPKQEINDDYGRTGLHRAILSSQPEEAMIMISQGADLDACDPLSGWTALHMSAIKGYGNLVALLLENGARPDAQDNSGLMPIHWAIEAPGKDQLAIVTLLLPYCEDLEAEDRGGWTLLHRAAISSHTDIVRLLLQRGANVESMDNGGCTPLHRAVLSGNLFVVSLLLLRKADPWTKDKLGQNAFSMAYRMEDEDMWSFFSRYHDCLTLHEGCKGIFSCR